MKWIGRVVLAALSLLVLARAASAQQGYQPPAAVPPGYVKVDNPQDYLPGYPEGGIPVAMGADGRYYAQAGGYQQSGYQTGYQGGYVQGGYAGGYGQPVVVTEPCCGGAPRPYPQPYPVPQPVPQPCGGPPPACGGYSGGYGYPGVPAGGVVVVEETCCSGGGYPAPAPAPYPAGYGYGQPVMQIVETGPCCAQGGYQGGGYSGGYSAGGYYGTGYHPAPGPCCVPPGPPPACDTRRPPNAPYACGEVVLRDSFFYGGGGVGPEYIPGGGGGGGAYAYAGAGATAYASASAGVRVSIGGRGGGRPHKPPHGGKGCGCH